MKKRYFLSFAFLLLFFSCKKDRVCTCVITKTGTITTSGKVGLIILPGFPEQKLADTSFTENVLEIQFSDKKMKHLTKRKAKNNCISYTEPYHESTPIAIQTSSVHLVLSSTGNGEKEYKCELK